MHISNVSSVNHASGVAFSRYARQDNAIQEHHASFDSVTISEEARKACQNARQSHANASQNDLFSSFSSPENRKMEEALADFFNKTHSGTGAIELGELLPENRAIKDRQDAEIQSILDEENYAPPAMASPELLKKIDPIRRKNDALLALGDKMIMTDDVLEKASSFLQKMEKSEKGKTGDDNSLQSRFQAAIKGVGDTPTNSMTEEERLRKIKEEIMEKMRS